MEYLEKKHRRFWRRKKISLLSYLLATIIALYILGPIFWLVLSSLTNEIDLVFLGRNLRPPTSLSLNEYRDAFTTTILFKSLIDTCIYSLLSAFLTVSIASLAAYAFSFFAFPQKRSLFLFLLAVSTIPGWAIAVPIFLYLKRLALFDTYFAVIYANAGFLLPFAVWMLIGFFKTIPAELEDAALIDGCNKIQALLRIVLPLAAPGLAVIIIWSFLCTWGDFGWALILTSARVSALTVTVAGGLGLWGAKYGLITAQGVVSLGPPVIIAVICQKYLIKGLTMGAVKG